MLVYLEVRKDNSLGVFCWRTVSLLETDRERAREAAINEAHSSGYETRGVTLDLEQARREREYGTLFEGLFPI